jgi:hypothetical protein
MGRSSVFCDGVMHRGHTRARPHSFSSLNPEYTEAVAVGDRVRQKIDTRTLIGTPRDCHWYTGSHGSLASSPSAHLQPFLVVEAAELLVVHDKAILLQEKLEPAVAEPAGARWPARADEFAR